MTISTRTHNTPGDLRYLEERLTKHKGRYYLHVSGGAMTYAAVCIDNYTWTGGHLRMLLTEQEAQLWLSGVSGYEIMWSMQTDDFFKRVVRVS